MMVFLRYISFDLSASLGGPFQRIPYTYNSMVYYECLQYSSQRVSFGWDLTKNGNHIQAVHDKMRVYHFLLYLSQMFTDFASIWVILKLFSGP